MGFPRRYCGLLFAVLLVTAGCAEQGSTFRMLVPAQPFDREVAAELVDVFEQNSRHRIELVPMPSSFETALDALESGYADLALTANTQPFRQGITTVMPFYPTVLHILVRRERSADSAEELLRGATVYAGPVGSASRQLLSEIIDALDIDASEVTFVDNTETLPDVTLVYLPISPEQVRGVLEQADIAGNYRFLSFGSPDDIGTGGEVDRAVLLNPRLSPFVIPVGTYGDLPEVPVLTLAVDKLLVSGPGLDSAVVYDLIGEIRRLQPALAAKRPFLFRDLGAEFDASGSTFVLHPGSQAFAVRDEPTFYERYSGVAEVLVTLVIGLVSGIYAVIQIYNRRRKNRIDGFYADVMAIRDSINERSSANERAAAVGRVRQLQNKAFDMLINEKLAADESFRIFVTLSNDIVDQIK
ncbi:MAG: hypothetical protein GWP60_12680 [Gammaproteobacteria bacterium]|jgi:TRAP-type uncharacterized transport system substrate-binding protein|nr:hypothetical protein [Gammaproteobacteria bacterium]